MAWPGLAQGTPLAFVPRKQPPSVQRWICCSELALKADEREAVLSGSG